MLGTNKVVLLLLLLLTSSSTSETLSGLNYTHVQDTKMELTLYQTFVHVAQSTLLL